MGIVPTINLKLSNMPDKMEFWCCLPPEAQPLDCTVFSPFKAQWRTVFHEYFQANSGKVITNFNFVGLFAKAFMQAVTLANLVAGFKSCGIYPLDSSVIQTLVSVSDRRSSASYAQQSKKQKSQFKWFSGNTAIQDQQLQSSDSSAIQSENCAGNQSTVAHSSNDDGTDNTLTDGSNNFTIEQQELFKKRCEEGFDLFIDVNYVRWIELHYPDKNIPTDGGLTCDFFKDIVPASPMASFENLYLSPQTSSS